MRKITEKIDNTVTLTDECLTGTPPMPQSVKIDLMRTCNYKCSFCYHSKLENSTGEMDFELYKKIINELKEIGVKEVAPFFFGESFLSKNLPKAIQYAKDTGFEYVFLTTNGSMANPTKVHECMKAGLNSLKFSINYSDEEQFKEVTNISGKYFRRVIENIKSAREIRDEGDYDCGLYASYILYDGEQGEKMKGLLDEISPFLDEIYALPLYSQASTITKEGWDFSGGNQGRAGHLVPPVPCWALFREAHINYDGTLCACCFSVSDDFNMGDVSKESFKDAWHSEKFIELRKKHLSGDIKGTVCENCIIKRN